MVAPGVAKLKVENVSKTFAADRGPVRALDDIAFEMPLGEFLTIVGPSGCGKSTLFNIIAGLIQPDPGARVMLDGAVVEHLLGKIGYMPQRDLLFPWRDVLDNAILGLELQGVPKAEARREALGLFDVFGLAGFEHAYPYSLSGGMRQRVALMRAYLFRSDVMLLDEPFGALDALTRGAMQEWLTTIWERLGRTILFITHDIDEAIFLGDRVLVMTSRPGRVKAEIKVGVPRPRRQTALTDPAFVELKRTVLELIREESARAIAQEPPVGQPRP